jgi:hypothetical protein
MTRPRSSDPSRARGSRLALVLAAAAAASCAAPLAVPPATVVAQARVVPSYSARLNVTLRGPELRARTRVLLAFRRPDGLRIEIPGPAGARLVAVAQGERLVGIAAGERAVYGGAPREGRRSLLGVALAPRGDGPPSWRASPRCARIGRAGAAAARIPYHAADGAASRPRRGTPRPRDHPRARAFWGAAARRLSAVAADEARPSGAADGHGPALHLRAHAKVTSPSRCSAPARDGYHELRTLFQTISLHETSCSGRARAATMVCDHPPCRGRDEPGRAAA